jgi:hypothetical protein
MSTAAEPPKHNQKRKKREKESVFLIVAEVFLACISKKKYLCAYPSLPRIFKIGKFISPMNFICFKISI